MKSIFKNAAVVMATIAALVACDSDINSLGSDFLGVDVDNLIKTDEFSVTTFSTALNAVQTNRFTSQPFGVYDDPVYGRSYHEFVSQLTIPLANPDFGTNVVLDSVVLTIPLYSTVATIDGDNRTFTLDSVYNATAENLVRIYENNFFLNNFDPQNLTQASTYFSDLRTSIEQNKGALIFEDSAFKPSASEVRLISTSPDGTPITTDDGVEVTSRSAPAYRKTIARKDSSDPILVANTSYWMNKIINQQGTSNLSSVSSFQNYFRGLYFSVDNNSGTPGNLSHLNPINPNGAAVILYYTSMIQDLGDINNNGSTTDLIEFSSSYRLEFSGNRANLIRQDLNPTIQANLLTSGNQTLGDPSLYLKGGPGAMAFIDLFGADLDLDGEADELTELRARGVVVNDATLTFFVDQSQVGVGGRTEPERIIIYDVENRVPLADFSFSTNSTSPGDPNFLHLGRLTRTESGNLDTKGVSYTLKLTRHVAQVLAGTRANVRLGIAVTQNVNLAGGFSAVRDNNSGNAVTIDQILLGSAISHEGTVLHGNTTLETAKRPIFKVSYTEAN